MSHLGSNATFRNGPRAGSGSFACLYSVQTVDVGARSCCCAEVTATYLGRYVRVDHATGRVASAVYKEQHKMAETVYPYRTARVY